MSAPMGLDCSGGANTTNPYASPDDEVVRLVVDEDDNVIIGGRFSVVTYGPDADDIAFRSKLAIFDKYLNLKPGAAYIGDTPQDGSREAVYALARCSGKRLYVFSDLSGINQGWRQVGRVYSALNPNVGAGLIHYSGQNKVGDDFDSGTGFDITGIGIPTLPVVTEADKLGSDQVIVVGAFNSFGPITPIDGLLSLQTDGSEGSVARPTITGVAPGGQGMLGVRVRASDNKFFIIGTAGTWNGFDTWAGGAVAGLVLMDSSGTIDTGFDISTVVANCGGGLNLGVVGTGLPTPIQIYGSGVIVGGQISAPPVTSYTLWGVSSPGSVVPTYGVTVLNADGTLNTGFATASGLGNGTNGTGPLVYALAVQGDGKVVVGGHFPEAFGSTRKNLCRLNADGTLDNAFVCDVTDHTGDASLSSITHLALQSDGSIIACGNFEKIGGESRLRLARISSSGVVMG